MAEKEYIERADAMNAVLVGDIDKDFPQMDIAARLHDIPAADVRPVVLCRDCKFAPIGDRDGDDLEWPFDGNPCPHKCADNWYSHKPAPDFFCAAGENREENKE